MKILTSTPLKYNQNTYTKKRNNAQTSFGINPTGVIKKTTSLAGNAVTDGLAYGFGWLGTTRPVQKLVDVLKDTNYQRHLSAFVGVVLSSFYMIDTAKSKTIEKDQKMPLIMNQGTVCVLSTAGAYTLDKYLDKKLENFTDTINIANISNNDFRDAMTKYHANKEDLSVLEETAKVLKTPEQIINKQILDAFDNPTELNKVKEELKGNKYSQKLFAQLETSENPKQILKENYEKTNLFTNLLKEKFQLSPKDIKSLEKAVKEEKADESAKELLKEIKSIAKEEKDKLGKSTEMFFNRMKSSPLLQKMYAKNRFSAAMDIIAETDSKLSVRSKGFRYAKSMMVFAMIYRFASPVFATPLANMASAYFEKRNKAPKSV